MLNVVFCVTFLRNSLVSFLFISFRSTRPSKNLCPYGHPVPSRHPDYARLLDLPAGPAPPLRLPPVDRFPDPPPRGRLLGHGDLHHRNGHPSPRSPSPRVRAGHPRRQGRHQPRARLHPILLSTVRTIRSPRAAAPGLGRHRRPGRQRHRASRGRPPVYGLPFQDLASSGPPRQPTDTRHHHRHRGPERPRRQPARGRPPVYGPPLHDLASP
jgi:hypothetical protein